MERPSFSDRIDKTIADVQAAQRAAEKQAEEKAEQERQRNEELQEARERMRALYREVADRLTKRGVETEIGKATLGTNAVGMKGYNRPATEFVTVTLPEGWVIGRSTKGDAMQVLTREGRIFHAVSQGSYGHKTGDIVETSPDDMNDYAVDDDGPYLAVFDQYGEHPPQSREEMFIRQVAHLLQ